jgi:hypothetical protein
VLELGARALAALSVLAAVSHRLLMTAVASSARGRSQAARLADREWLVEKHVTEDLSLNAVGSLIHESGTTIRYALVARTCDGIAQSGAVPLYPVSPHGSGTSEAPQRLQLNCSLRFAGTCTGSPADGDSLR